MHSLANFAASCALEPVAFNSQPQHSLDVGYLVGGRDLKDGYNGAGFLCLLAAARAYDHATSRTGADVECAANGCHALVHADQPQIFSLPLLLLQTTPVIGDQQGDGAILFAA